MGKIIYVIRHKDKQVIIVILNTIKGANHRLRLTPFYILQKIIAITITIIYVNAL